MKPAPFIHGISNSAAGFAVSCTTCQAERCKGARTVPGSRLAGRGFDEIAVKHKRACVADVDTVQAPQKPPEAVCGWRELDMPEPRCGIIHHSAWIQ